MSKGDPGKAAQNEERVDARPGFPWLKKLGPNDRATAERWLNEPGGESRLRRIADAINKRDRGRGAPAKDYIWLIRRAIEAWMTNPGVDESGASRRTVEALSETERENVTPERLRRIAREGLEDWVEHATLGTLIETEADLLSRSLPLRQDTAAARLKAAVDRLAGPRLRNLAVRAHAKDVKPSASSTRLADTVALLSDPGDRISRLARFGSAFPEFFPPETPASMVANAYDVAWGALNQKG